MAEAEQPGRPLKHGWTAAEWEAVTAGQRSKVTARAEGILARSSNPRLSEPQTGYGDEGMYMDPAEEQSDLQLTLASAATPRNPLIAEEITTIIEEPAVFKLEHNQEEEVLALFNAASGLTRNFTQRYVDVLSAAADVTDGYEEDIPDFDSYGFNSDEYSYAADDAGIQGLYLDALPVLQQILIDLLKGDHAQEVYELLKQNAADWIEEHPTADGAYSEEAKQYITRANAAAAIVQTIKDLIEDIETSEEEDESILDENAYIRVFDLLDDRVVVYLLKPQPLASDLLQEMLEDIHYEEDTIDAIDDVTLLANERRALLNSAQSQLRNAVAQGIEPLIWGSEFLSENTTGDSSLTALQQRLINIITENEREADRTAAFAREKLRGPIFRDIVEVDQRTYDIAAFAISQLTDDVLLGMTPRTLPEGATIDTQYEVAADNMLLLLNYAKELQAQGIISESLQRFNPQAQIEAIDGAINQVKYKADNTNLLYTLTTLRAEVEHHNEVQRQREKLAHEALPVMTAFEVMRSEANILLGWAHNQDPREIADALDIAPEELPARLEALGRDVNIDQISTKAVIDALLQLRQAQNGEMPTVQVSEDTSFRARNEQIMASITPFLESLAQGEPEWPSEEVRIMVLGKLEAARIALELPDNYNINDLMQILLRDLNLDSADQLDALASFRADKTNTTHSEA